MKKILIIRFSSLGDLVSLEYTFRTIKHFFKDDEVTFLTSNIGKSLYIDSGYFDKFIIKNRFLRTVNGLRKEKYDIVINLQCNKPSHYISMLLKKDLVINKSFNLFQKLFKIKTKSKTAEEILDKCNFSKENLAAYFNKNKEFILLPSSKSEFDLRKKYTQKIVAISTGTSERWVSKKWGLHNFINLIDGLIDNGNQVVLVGTSLEVEDSNAIVEKFGDKVLSLVDKTNLTQLKNVLAEVDLFVGNDSGPAHIAAGVGTNTVTIFGSTDIKHCVKFMPYTGNHYYFKPGTSISCHPCYKTKCPTQMECMESIKVKSVLKKIEDTLNA